MEGVEFIRYGDLLFGMVIRKTTHADKTRFFTPDESPLQFGLLAHPRGFVEPPHYHKPIPRTIRALQQMFVVQRGTVAMDFFDAQGRKVVEVVASPGDAVLLMDGAHSLRGLEDFQCVSVKQGPFLGAENDKVEISPRS